MLDWIQTGCSVHEVRTAFYKTAQDVEAVQVIGFLRVHLPDPWIFCT